MHTPVLLQEVIHYLNPQPGDFIIDGTINGGGHSAAILKKISPSGKILGVDWDKRLLEQAESKFKSYKSKVILVNTNYADLPEILTKEKLGKADGLLLDLGFSTEQIEKSKRGFSFDRDEPLLMTYSDDQKPVAQIIRELSEKELADIIFKFSGERFSRKIAAAIKTAGKKKRITSSLELAEIIRGALPKNYERGRRRGGASRIDPATRTFQALRIYANDELGNLEKALENLKSILKANGRVVIISFHSLEDALVKKYFQKMEKFSEMKILTKKPVKSTRAEIEANLRSRSAKLRAAIIT